jgi:capsular exopolysaccharide synthesis family protein
MSDVSEVPGSSAGGGSGLPGVGGGGSLAVPRHALAPFAGAVGGTGSASGLDVNDLLRILLKWKWLILGVVAACTGLAVAYTVTATRIYRGTATIEINTDPTSIMGDADKNDHPMRTGDQFLQTQYGLLKSRALADRVQRMLGLSHVGPLEVTPVRGSSLIELDYSDRDPQRAAQVVNAFANGFIDDSLERRYNATAFARTFLQNRLASTRQKLEASERQLVNYAQNQGIVEVDSGSEGGGGGGGGDGGKGSGGGGGGGGGDSLSSQSLVALNGALSSAIGERIAAEQRYRQSLTNKTSSEVLESPTVQALRTQRAQLVADYRTGLITYKPDYPEMVALKSRIDEIDHDLAAETTNVSSSLRSTYDAAVGREQALRAQVSSLRSNVLDLRNRGIGYNILERDVETNRQIYDALLQRFKEIGAGGGVGESIASVVDTALPPTSPYRPRPVINLAFGLLGGLVLGFGIAFGIEFVDDTIKSPEDVAEKLKVPMLGLIPRIAKTSSLVQDLADPRSEVAEAYYSVMTALQFVTNEGLPKTILMTSSRAAEGKSSSSLALAQNLARIGASVLLVDADMRKPSFKSKASETLGLSSLLTTDQAVMDHVVVTNVPRLSLLPSGPIPPNPAELLGTGRIRRIIDEASEQFDVVVVDAPPVLGLADAPVLSSICEGTVVVVEAASVRRPVVLNSLARLRAANAHIVGVVLTKYNPKHAGYGYAYGYGYGYGQRYGQDPAQTPMLDVNG